MTSIGKKKRIRGKAEKRGGEKQKKKKEGKRKMGKRGERNEDEGKRKRRGDRGGWGAKNGDAQTEPQEQGRSSGQEKKKKRVKDLANQIES